MGLLLDFNRHAQNRPRPDYPNDLLLGGTRLNFSTMSLHKGGLRAAVPQDEFLFLYYTAFHRGRYCHQDRILDFINGGCPSRVNDRRLSDIYYEAENSVKKFEPYLGQKFRMRYVSGAVLYGFDPKPAQIFYPFSQPSTNPV